MKLGRGLTTHYSFHTEGRLRRFVVGCAVAKTFD